MTTGLKSLSLRLKVRTLLLAHPVHAPSVTDVSVVKSIKACSVDTASVVAETNVDVTVIEVKREE